MYSACAQAANTIARREKRYFSATASLTMEDGEMTDLFDMNAVHVLPAPDPEENAVQRDLLARLLQSDEDRSIAGRMAEGLTVREIAAALKLHEFKVGLYRKSLSRMRPGALRNALDACTVADRTLKLSPQGYTALERLICSV